MIIITRRPTDLIEFTFKTSRTTISINAESAIGVVADPSGLEIGDPVIIAVGGEAGGGLINTDGVGGRRAAVDAEDTRYYARHDVPRALITEIVDIDGNNVELADEAVTSTTNAVLWHNNYDRWIDQTPGDLWSRLQEKRIRFPAGDIAFHDATGYLHFGVPHRALVEGALNGGTRIVCPPGVYSMKLLLHEPDDVLVRNFTFQNNYKLHGWMLGEGESGWINSCGVNINAALRPVVHNVRGIDPSASVVEVTTCTSPRLSRITSYRSTPCPQYPGWDLISANCTDARWYDCGSESDYLHTALETFQGNGDQFFRFRGRNALVATNNSGGWRFDDCRFDYQAGSHYTTGLVPKTNGAFNVNTNIGVTPELVALGGVIHNTRIIFAGFTAPDPDNDMLKPIVVNASNPNIQITGDDYTKALIQGPDWDSDSTHGSGPAIVSTGLNTTVDGVRIIGAANPTYGNISLGGAGSVAQNNVADAITAPTETNNQTNAEYEA